MKCGATVYRKRQGGCRKPTVDERIFNRCPKRYQRRCYSNTDPLFQIIWSHCIISLKAERSTVTLGKVIERSIRKGLGDNCRQGGGRACSRGFTPELLLLCFMWGMDEWLPRSQRQRDIGGHDGGREFTTKITLATDWDTALLLRPIRLASFAGDGGPKIGYHLFLTRNNLKNKVTSKVCIL